MTLIDRESSSRAAGLSWLFVSKRQSSFRIGGTAPPDGLSNFAWCVLQPLTNYFDIELFKAVQVKRNSASHQK